MDIDDEGRADGGEQTHLRGLVRRLAREDGEQRTNIKWY